MNDCPSARLAVAALSKPLCTRVFQYFLNHPAPITPALPEEYFAFDCNSCFLLFLYHIGHNKSIFFGLGKVCTLSGWCWIERKQSKSRSERGKCRSGRTGLAPEQTQDVWLNGN